MNKRILFLFNPKSGTGNTGVPPLAVEKHIRLHSDVSILVKVQKGIEALLREKIEHFKPTHVVAIGGDGTVKLAAEAIIHTTIQLGIIPGGSANGLATELDMPIDPDTALSAILHKKARSIDLVCINNKYSIHLADLGFNARLVEGFEKGNMRGMLGYALEFASLWPDPELFDVEIQIGDETIRRSDVLMVVMANSERYGTGAIINPNGKLDDGVMEICLVKNLKLLNLVEMMFRTKLMDKTFLEQLKVSNEARIKLSKKMPFQIDGELEDPTDTVDVHLEKGAIQLVG